MQEQSTQPTAIPFILNSQRGFFLTPEAMAFLRGLTAPVGVITVVGKYRTGKSLFVNRVLLNNPGGFKVGPTVNPCTKGLWLWRETLRSDNPDFPEQEVLVIDSEGFGGTDENSNHDSKIMLFALLLSSFFIYNSVGSIDENSLNCLNLIINLAKQIQSKASEQIDGYFPSFLWVIRDFTLQIVDKDGCPMGAKEYLQKALEMQKGVSDAIENKNKLRRMFKHFFKDRDCATLVRPVESETGLQNLNTLDESELRPQFTEQIKALRKKIFKKVKPKSIRGRVLNGPMLIELATAYLEAVNNGGLPSVESAWTYVRRRASEQAVDLAINQLQGTLDNNHERNSETQLKQLKKTLKSELLATFQKKAIGSEEQVKSYLVTLKEQMNKRLAEFNHNNLRKWTIYYEGVFDDVSRDLREQLEAGKVNSIQDYRRLFAQLKEQFMSKCEEGPSRSEFLKDMEIRMNNEHLYRLAGSMESLRVKQVEFAELRCEKLEEERRSDRRQTKQLEHRVWELEKMLSCKEDEIEGLNRRSQHITSGLKNQLQKAQSQLLGRKSSEERLQSEAEYLKKLVEDSKLRLEGLTSRLIEMEIAKKQLFEENKNSVSELENANFLLATKQEELTRLHRQLQKTQEVLEREKHKEAKLSENCTKLKVDNELRHNELTDLRDKYTRLLKEFDEANAAKYDLNGEVREAREKLDSITEKYETQLDALRATLQQELSTKHELSETNKNLSSAVSRMELRTKQAEEKIEALKDYKKAIKNASCLQCQHCSKFVACAIFTQHLNICTNNGGSMLNSMEVSLQKTNPVVVTQQKPIPLEISITQTLVRQCDSKPYTEYVICLAKGTARWTVTRKYKAFCQLHNSLRISMPGITLSEVAYIVNPQQGNRKSLLIEQRRKLLQRYLRDISENELVQRQKCFITFMELPKENDRMLATVGADRSLLPQSPEEFLKSWNERNQRLKETTAGKRQALR